MVGEQLRAILTQAGCTMTEFADFVKRSPWTVQRWCRPGVRVADRWVVQLAVFLAKKGLPLSHYLPDQERSLPATDFIRCDNIEPVEELKRKKASKRKGARKQSSEQLTGTPVKPINLDDWQQNLKEQVRNTVDTFSSTKPLANESDRTEQKDNPGKKPLDMKERNPANNKREMESQ